MLVAGQGLEQDFVPVEDDVAAGEQAAILQGLDGHAPRLGWPSGRHNAIGTVPHLQFLPHSELLGGHWPDMGTTSPPRPDVISARTTRLIVSHEISGMPGACPPSRSWFPLTWSPPL